ncbi:hypothetical protein BC939DRAFT_437871 [Gamsiella multidivaricata]|uniref:uncharacterized protein n=1 Tax=Gamsiella multidivaricata TaxID=101098 RepID=UPI00221F8F5E|nr:uncharacterized protein BC939DRAFT_437871 [Gamsiella multidivaricata]KAI7831189.1 hypothetical protein BC939DRAFT_437871 [Gamsiella multidivaricata]
MESSSSSSPSSSFSPSSSSTLSDCDLPEKTQLAVDLSVGCSPCPEALLSLAAESVLSVLQCSPRCSYPKSAVCTSTASIAAATTATTAGAGEEHHLVQFLRNICVKACVTELALVISLIYVDRLKKVLTNMARGDPDTPFKIILSALLVVKKFIEEDCVGLNRMFSKITDGLYSVHDINTMERSFLGLLKFSLYVTDKDVAHFIQSHQHELQGVDILKTYTNKSAAAA